MFQMEETTFMKVLFGRQDKCMEARNSGVSLKRVQVGSRMKVKEIESRRGKMGWSRRTD